MSSDPIAISPHSVSPFFADTYLFYRYSYSYMLQLWLIGLSAFIGITFFGFVCALKGLT